MDERQKTSHGNFDEVARAERAETASRLNEVKRRIEALRGEERDLEERIEHLNALIGDAIDDEVTTTAVASPDDAADLVIAILKDAEAPMHFRQIYEEFVKRGGSIGGKDPANNLLTKFYDDPRVRRTGRGTYVLGVQPATPSTPHSPPSSHN